MINFDHFGLLLLRDFVNNTRILMFASRELNDCRQMEGEVCNVVALILKVVNQVLRHDKYVCSFIFVKVISNNIHKNIRLTAFILASCTKHKNFVYSFSFE